MNSICVFCSASDAIDPRYTQMASDLGRRLARAGKAIVYGGARNGMMGALADAGLAEGGVVTGVYPQALGAQETAHQNLTHMHYVPNMHVRQQMMADLSDGFIILPGGIGTLAEFFEIITWKSIGLHQKPIYLVNAYGYWNQLLAQFGVSAEQQFFHRRYDHLFEVSDDLDALGWL